MTHRLPRLDDNEVAALHEAALAAGLGRQALLSGLPYAYMASFSTDGPNDELILLDIRHMNGIVLPGNVVPLLCWLSNAAALSQSHPASRRAFQDALTRLEPKGPSSPEAAPVVSPHLRGTAHPARNSQRQRREAMSIVGTGQAGKAIPPAGSRTHRSMEAWSDDITLYRGRVHFAIITVKPEEEDAILERFPREHSVSGQRDYGLCRVANARGEQLLVASVRQPRQGNIYANTVTRDLITDLDPRWILLVGIAGASPFGDAVLGDIVLGTHVHDLTVHARNPDGSTAFSAGGGAATPEVEMTAVHLRSTLEKVMAFPPSNNPPAPLNLTFTTDEQEINKRIEASLKVGRKPKIFDGPLISTDALVKDVELVKTWREVMRNTLAIEMESAGAYSASRTRAKSYAMLPIRGISDIVGLSKQEHAVLHACHIAAECALHFTRQWSPPPSIGGTETKGPLINPAHDS